MTNEIVDMLRLGVQVVLRQRIVRGQLRVDTELSGRPIGLMALSKLEQAGIVRKKEPPMQIRKGCVWEYELAPSVTLVNEDELPAGYPYHEMFPFSIIPDGVGCRLFPVKGAVALPIDPSIKFKHLPKEVSII